VNNVGAVELTYLKNILQNYPPDLFVRPSDVISIDEKRIATDIANELTESAREYLGALSDLFLRKDKYSRNNFVSIRAWLSKIVEALTALENIIRLCENLSNVFKNEICWARALAIQSMIDIIAVAKREIGALKDQLSDMRHYSRIRDRVFIIITRRLAQVLDILYTMIAIESHDLPSTAITSIIGQSTANSAACCGAIK
jgi:hypothetical protein